MANQAGGRAPRKLSIERRLAAIRQRRSELAQATPNAPAGGTQLNPLQAAQRWAREADQRRRDSTARAGRVRQGLVSAFYRAARSHERTAEVLERAVRERWGDVAGHQRMAEFHRAAALADRQRAAEFQQQTTQHYV
jgi:hypothetical protein